MYLCWGRQPTFQCNSPLKVPAPAPFSFVTTLLDQAAGLLVSFCSNRQVLYRTKSQLAPIRKGGEDTMKLLKRLLVEEHGQGLVEYTLIVVLPWSSGSLLRTRTSAVSWRVAGAILRLALVIRRVATRHPKSIDIVAHHLAWRRDCIRFQAKPTFSSHARTAGCSSRLAVFPSDFKRF
jgi:hypothetical protein